MIRKSFFFIVFIIILSTIVYATDHELDCDLDDCTGLAGVWHFNGNANDDSGNNLDGTLSGDGDEYLTGASCKFNGCIEFDGTNDHLYIADSPYTSNLDEFTIQAYIYPNANEADSEFVNKNEEYVLRLDQGILQAEMSIGEGQAEWGGGFFDTENSVSVGEWAKITMTWDGDVLKLYKNDGLVGNFDITDGSTFDHSGYLRFGRGQYVYFGGRMDDVTFWNYARDPTQIVPRKPSNVAATVNDCGSVTVTWIDNSDDETGFQVYRGSTQVGSTGSNTETFTDNDAQESKSYIYKVKSCSSKGCSSSVSASAVNTGSCPYKDQQCYYRYINTDTSAWELEQITNYNDISYYFETLGGGPSDEINFVEAITYDPDDGYLHIIHDKNSNNEAKYSKYHVSTEQWEEDDGLYDADEYLTDGVTTSEYADSLVYYDGDVYWTEGVNIYKIGDSTYADSINTKFSFLENNCDNQEPTGDACANGGYGNGGNTHEYVTAPTTMDAMTGYGTGFSQLLYFDSGSTWFQTGTDPASWTWNYWTDMDAMKLYYGLVQELTEPEAITFLADGSRIVFDDCGDTASARYSPAYGSTDLASMSDEELLNIDNLTLANSNGQIKWGDTINGLDQLYDIYVKIEDNLISVDTEHLNETHNASADLTMDNVDCDNVVIYYAEGGSYSTREDVLEFDQICDGASDPSCTNIQCSDGTLTFTVSHFTGFAIGGYSTLTINDSAEGSSVLEDIAIDFFAYYLNSSSELVNDANCTIAFDDDAPLVWYQMTDQAEYYYYNKAGGFADPGLHYWYVNCTSPTVDDLFATDNVTVTAVSGGPTAIPEFNTIGILLIIIIAAVGIALMIKRKK